MNPPRPPWQAHWIWSQRHPLHPWNTYALFRKQLTLPSKPKHAPVRVSADQKYTLYVNGHRLHHGPARSSPDHQSYDDLDLAPHLQQGPNTLCAIAYQVGIPTFSNQFRDSSGFILDGIINLDNTEYPLHTNHSWLSRESPAWTKTVARSSMQRGFVEFFDANDFEPLWTSPEFSPDPALWKKPHSYGPPPTHPWLTMTPRQVPLLTHRFQKFQKIVAQFRGQNARGYKIATNAYALPLTEKRTLDKSPLPNLDAILHDDQTTAVIPPPPEGSFLMLVLDLGLYRTGHFSLDITNAHGEEIIDVIYTDDLDKTNAPHLRANDASSIATADRYRCRPGAQSWETFQYNGLRYVTLVFRNLQHPLTLRHVAFRQIHANLPNLGSLQTSDVRLDQIWTTARETQLNCAFDAFVDCSSREQAQWWGDARIQGKVALHAFGDTSILRRGIRQMAQSQAPDGCLNAHPPSDTTHYLPDFCLAWIGALHDEYYNTAQTDLLTECLPTLHRLMAFFAAHELHEHLIGDFQNFWLFLDWRPLHKENFSALLNLLYLQSLRWASQISQLAADPKSSQLYAKKAAALETAVVKHFFDPAANLWRDGFDPKTQKPIDQISQHANALAILLNLKPETHDHLARTTLLQPALSKKSKIITGTPFYYAFILQAMIHANLRADAVEVIRQKWGKMLDDGATTFFEHFDPLAGSICHAWSASPLYLLSQQILGITPTSPGWKTIQISPLTAGLDFARGKLPSPNGIISIDWEKSQEDQIAVRLEIPPNTTATFIDPLQNSRQLPPGIHEFNT